MKRGGGLKAERLFLPGRTNPVRMLPNSRGLLLLQRIRDEAHRFAIEYQRDLRRKRNLTSILEELPGIGPTKRRALLKELGSLRRVKEASAEELVAVPGVSQRDAENLRAFFDAVDAEPVEPTPSSSDPSESEGDVGAAEDPMKEARAPTADSSHEADESSPST